MSGHENPFHEIKSGQHHTVEWAEGDEILMVDDEPYSKDEVVCAMNAYASDQKKIKALQDEDKYNKKTLDIQRDINIKQEKKIKGLVEAASKWPRCCDQWQDSLGQMHCTECAQKTFTMLSMIQEILGLNKNGQAIHQAGGKTRTTRTTTAGGVTRGIGR